jgi:hypothetical protein
MMISFLWALPKDALVCGIAESFAKGKCYAPGILHSNPLHLLAWFAKEGELARELAMVADILSAISVSLLDTVDRCLLCMFFMLVRVSTRF